MARVSFEKETKINLTAPPHPGFDWANPGLFKDSCKLYYEGMNLARGFKWEVKTLTVVYTGMMIPVAGGYQGVGSGTATINREKHGLPV